MFRDVTQPGLSLMNPPQEDSKMPMAKSIGPNRIIGIPSIIMLNPLLLNYAHALAAVSAHALALAPAPAHALTHVPVPVPTPATALALAHAPAPALAF